MEDSGREKLQAEQANNGAVDAKEMKFDSASIKKKQGEEHFTNVEGAEARARAAEKARLEAEKAREKAEEQTRKEQKKADDAYVKSFVESQDKLEKEQKKADKKAQKEADHLEETPNQRKAKRKKTVIIIAIVLAVLALICGVLLIIFKKTHVSDFDANIKATEYFLEMREKANSGDYEEILKAREEYIKTIEESGGNLKFYHVLGYIEFSATYNIGYSDIKDYLQWAEDEVRENEEKQEELKDIRCFVYDVYDKELYEQECLMELKDNE